MFVPPTDVPRTEFPPKKVVSDHPDAVLVNEVVAVAPDVAPPVQDQGL